MGKEKAINEVSHKETEELSDVLCPDCGAEVRYYHFSHEHGDGCTKMVCSKKCSGWKVIKEINRLEELKKRQVA